MAAQGVGGHGIENRAEQPIAVENVDKAVVEDSEENGHGGRAPDQSAREQTTSGLIVSENFGIPSGDARRSGRSHEKLSGRRPTGSCR